MTFRLFGRDVSASAALKAIGARANKTASEVEAGSRREAIAREKAAASAAKASAAQEKAAEKAERAEARRARAIGGLRDAAAAVASAIAVKALVAATVTDAIAYEQMASKLAGSIKNTGNAAHLSVAGLQERAAALESMSGVDEMAILNAENLLTAYRNVQNNAGKGNDIFNQATATALDMSVKKSIELGQATTFVGKALNDPVKGMALLRKQGVLLSAQQQEQVNSFVKAGEAAEAQKVILAGLAASYGGAAAAAGASTAGALARAQDAISDGFRDLGIRLLPQITAVSNWVASNAGPVFSKLGDIFDATGRAVAPLVGWVRDELMPAMREAAATVLPSAQEAFGRIRNAVTELRPYLAQVGTVITELIIPSMAQAAQVVNSVLGPAFSAVAGIVRTVVIPGFMAAAEVVAMVLQATATAVSAMLNLAARAAAAMGKDGVAASLRAAAADVSGYAAQMDGAIQAIRNRVVTVTIATVEVKGISMGKAATLQRQAGSGNDREGRSASASDIAAVTARQKAAANPSFGGGSSGYSGMTVPKSSGGGGGGGGASAKSAARGAVAEDLKAIAAALKESRKKAGEQFAKLAGDVSKAGSAAARRIVESYAKIVLPLAQKYEAITKSLKAAQDKLAKLRDDAKQYAADVKRDVVEGSKLGEQESVGGIINSLKESISYAAQFAAVLTRLRALGADATTIGQLVAAGPKQGLKLGEQLAATGKAGVAQVAGLQSQLNAAANTLGAGASNALYGAGISAAQGLVKGLASQSSALAAQMTKLATAM
ncbi:MAG: hypothetical protein KAX84_20815, partial [Burkholderiales bacterium]|nr:hypothetical protein [Burkholderiales bacterium]